MRLALTGAPALLAAALAAALVTTPATAAPAPTPTAAPTPAPAPAPAQYQIGTFNMAGGNAEHGTKGDEAPEALARSVRDRMPAVVAVQEGCGDWSFALWNKLREQQYDVLLNPVLQRAGGPNAECLHPNSFGFGNGLIMRKDIGFDPNSYRAHELTKNAAVDPARKDHKEQREMLCVTAPARQLVACSVHLTHDDRELRIAEAEEARRVLAVEYAGYTKLVGGDLNDDPMSAATDRFYDSGYGFGARGEFKEADSLCGNKITPVANIYGTPCRLGGRTHGSGKIDYLFVSPHVPVRWAQATSANHSDHVPLWAEVTL
ncbi:endonuclease/exonuclease/phosphatase family protein [Streptomyces sp. NBC_01506]|uniref:endonuclease/exonuclease/phosphatase family protein n=1 Tax=Streptomyces sp. NBC_01506 TaxID=2903887 RepID=UPI00386D89E5